VHCGTIWVHGPALRVPVTEDEPRTGYGEYGTGKVEIEALLQRETRTGGVPTIVLHHVRADDVAQAFALALSRPTAIGSSFHVVAEQAMTLRGLATGVAQWFGREPVLDSALQLTRCAARGPGLARRRRSGGHRRTAVRWRVRADFCRGQNELPGQPGEALIP
jgi:nucleoside-diphosphate-sugar epimerase